VWETDTQRRLFSLTNASTSEVLPAPDGAETMKSSPFPIRLLNVLDLLAHLLNEHFHLNGGASRLNHNGF